MSINKIMSINKRKCLLARVTLAALLYAAQHGIALAHVSLEVDEAPVGSYYKAILRVPHGCEGAATTALRIEIPEGVLAVKPMPKPGWNIETEKGNLSRAYSFHGEAITDGVKSITWKGGQLPDEEYDEFVFAAYLASELSVGTTLYLPVTQVCGGRSQGWTEVPSTPSGGVLEWPAPSLTLLPNRK